jgi:hypothetical protein
MISTIVAATICVVALVIVGGNGVIAGDQGPRPGLCIGTGNRLCDIVKNGTVLGEWTSYGTTHIDDLQPAVSLRRRTVGTYKTNKCEHDVIVKDGMISLQVISRGPSSVQWMLRHLVGHAIRVPYCITHCPLLIIMYHMLCYRWYSSSTRLYNVSEYVATRYYACRTCNQAKGYY